MFRFDFSVAGNMGYYDGMIFLGFIEGLNSSVLSGGRYDHLMKKMGKTSGAVGFSVSLNKLENMEREDKKTDVDILLLCAPDEDPSAISKAAANLRSGGHSVMVQKTAPAAIRAGRIVRLKAGEVYDE